MASVGKASLTIIPKFDRLGKTITNALDGIDTTPSGVKMGKGVANGIAKGTSGLGKSGAIMGVFSAATSKALDLISSSVGTAVSRLDTLNNYPRVMQALGYSAEDSEASIAKMADHLTGLPTALDDMTSTVQGISAMTGDLNKATDAGLALNDMLLASGSSTQLTSAAMEQFRQMLAKGNPEMEDWKSLTSAMPGQMAQLAKSMLGPTATANDLYAALGGGKNEAILSMDDLMAAMIRLDVEGGEGITSFAEQAKNAVDGVESGASNMQTAVARGMTGVLDSIGSDNISGALKGMGGAFEDALGVVGEGIEAVKPIASDLMKAVDSIGKAGQSAFGIVAGAAEGALPVVKGLSSALADSAPKILATAGAFAAFKVAGTHLAGFASKAKEARKASSLLEGANKLLGTSFSPVSLGITAVSAVLGIAATAYMDAQRKSENLSKATTGLSDAVSRATSLDDYAGKISGIGEKAASTAMSVDGLAESMASHVDEMNKASDEAETQIAQLNTAQGIIDIYTGKTDLSSDAQGRLEWALKLVNEQFGLAIESADVAAGAYHDAEGNVINLKDSINDLVEAKKNEIKMNQLSSTYDTLSSDYQNAADTYASTRKKFKDEYDRALSDEMEYHGTSEADARAWLDDNSKTWSSYKDMMNSQGMYDGAKADLKSLENEMGDLSKATSDNADEFDRWGNTLEPVFTSILKGEGTTFAGLKEDMRSLTKDTEKLGELQEDDLLRIADAYDGTAASIAGVLRDLGFEMDEAGATAALMASDITDSINGMDGVGDALEGVGVDVSDFGKKLADAGVSTEQLNAIGSDQLSQLAQNCGGSMDMMVWFIQHYNDTPLLDKDGNVQVEQAELMDAQGNLYTWNGSYLVDQNGRALVDDAELITGQGEIVTWNASSLKFQPGRASITSNVREQLGLRDDWNNGSFLSKVANASINIFRNITDFFSGGSQNAAGGIRLNAAGGYRFHGAGAIATKAVPLDIVGEDGAEAIVPLTNKRYSLPFAKTLAEQMGSAGGGLTKADMYDAVSAAIAPLIGREVAVYVDGKLMSSALVPYMDTEFGRMQERRLR